MNPTSGKTSKCRAIKSCPFGDAHFPSKLEADAAAEQIVKERYEWSQKEEQLNQLARAWLDSHGFLGVKVIWKDVLYDEVEEIYSFGFVKEGKLKRTIHFSREARMLNQKSQNELVPHELAHMIARNVSTTHGVEWLDAFDEIVTKDMPELNLTRADAQAFQYLSSDERARLDSSRNTRVEMKFSWECIGDPRHGEIVPRMPKNSGFCPKCSKPRFWKEL